MDPWTEFLGVVALTAAIWVLLLILVWLARRR